MIMNSCRKAAEIRIAVCVEIAMKKIYMFIMFIIILMSAGCKNNELKDTCVHKESIRGKIIEIRENNEILIEITQKNNDYNEGDIVLAGYSKYYQTNPAVLSAKGSEAVPELNDMVSVSYWKHDVSEKDGYDYIPNQQVAKIQRKLYGKVIEVRPDDEILIEVTKNQDQYKKGEVILIGYSLYYSVENNEIYGDKKEETPKYNDRVILSYWNEAVKKKDTYTYISNIQVQKK